MAAFVFAGTAMVLGAFALFLAFCVFVVVHTGSTAGLRDFAIALRAFGSVFSFRSRK